MIATTHIGSLPRPEKLAGVDLSLQGPRGVVDTDLIDEAVRLAVGQQIEVGLHVVNDGEYSKPGYATYLARRVGGIEFLERSRPPAGNGGVEASCFPGFFKRQMGRYGDDGSGGTGITPVCVSDLAWTDFSQVEDDIVRLQNALMEAGHKAGFMTAPSPATAAYYHPNEYYRDDVTYKYALADILRLEYQAIASAGLMLQIDCPDLMSLYRSRRSDQTIQDFRNEISINIEILNYATRGVDPSQMRMHVCCGSQEAPHTEDPPLEAVVDLLLQARPAGLTVVGANGRHGHEWQVWRDVKLPDGKYLLPGVIDSTTNVVEHPETVAERVLRYVNVAGAGNVVATVDCGFDAIAGTGRVDPMVAWAKLRSLTEGAARASDRLRSRG